MSGSVNKVILVGNLGRDPEVRTMPSGDKMVSFSLATTESWRDKNSGERRDKTEWHNVVIFNENLGRVAEQYCKKGSKIYIEGQLQTREYQDKDGNQRRATEVVLQRFRGELTSSLNEWHSKSLSAKHSRKPISLNSRRLGDMPTRRELKESRLELNSSRSAGPLAQATDKL